MIKIAEWFINGLGCGVALALVLTGIDAFHKWRRSANRDSFWR